MCWTGWRGIEESPEYGSSAVYLIRLVRQGAAVEIGRLCGVDPDGIIMIGQTGNMRERLSQFISAKDTCNGHSEGNLLYYLEKRSEYSKAYGDCGLQYKFRPCEDTAEAKERENRHIKSYVKRFGEVPPLNSAIPDRYEKRYESSWESAPLWEAAP